MAVKGIFSPEEKLLKLLRGGSERGAGAIKKAPRESAEPSYRIDRPYANLSIIKTMNRFLFIVFFISLAYLLFKFFRPSIYTARMAEVKTIEPITKLSDATEKQHKDVSFEDIKREDLFIPSYNKTSIIDGPFKNQAGMADFTLKGIVTGKNPQAIIEDKKDNKTYFLFKGDRLLDFEVKDILEGKVILETAEGVDIELKL